MMSVPLRVVIDSSVWLRYLIRPGAAIHRLIEDLWLNDRILVVSAPELMNELSEVLHRESIQSIIHPEEGQALLETLLLKAEFLPELGDIPPYTRDPKDDKFVACAVASQATFLITEDRDLLALAEMENLRILTPYDFIKTLLNP
jgi:uncharacterized protein